MRVVGLISGTAVDGVDGVIADIQGSGYALKVNVIAGETIPYPPALRQQILAVCAGEAIAMADLAELDEAIAQLFAQTALALIAQHGPVDLVASHGQTVFHRPPERSPQNCDRPLGYTVQLGRGDVISALTQCPTVSDFRQADIAVGGEGAPLVPPIDLALLSHPIYTRCVQNIGGIGNVTLLPPWDVTHQPRPPKVIGWDTGPGNSLLDLAVEHFSAGHQTYDHNGNWAAQGTPCQALVDQWLQHPYFQQLPPKSTGRELFGKGFFTRCLEEATSFHLSPADMLATLTEFTACSITLSYQSYLPQLPDEVLLCGGGSQNAYLVSRLQQQLPDITIRSTTAVGVPADLKEALAFAVLGYWRYHQFPSNLPEVTGAGRSVSLGILQEPLKLS